MVKEERRALALSSAMSALFVICLVLMAAGCSVAPRWPVVYGERPGDAQLKETIRAVCKVEALLTPEEPLQEWTCLVRHGVAI